MSIETYSRSFMDVSAAVKRQFGDESGVEITDSDIARWIDDAQREILLNNPDINAAMVQINVTAGQTAYPIASQIPDIFAIQSVHYDGEYISNMSFVEAQKYIMQKETGQGPPVLWFERAGVLNLYPKPMDDKEAGLSVFYNKRPTRVQEENDPLTVPDTFFKSVVDFCMTQAYLLDENPQLAQVTENHFNNGMVLRSNRTDTNRNTYPTITYMPEDM